MVGAMAEVDGVAAEIAAPDDGRGWRVAILVGVIALIWATTFGPGALRSAKKMLRDSWSGAQQCDFKQSADGGHPGKHNGSSSSDSGGSGQRPAQRATPPQAAGSAASARQRSTSQQ